MVKKNDEKNNHINIKDVLNDDWIVVSSVKQQQQQQKTGNFVLFLNWFQLCGRRVSPSLGCVYSCNAY